MSKEIPTLVGREDEFSQLSRALSATQRPLVLVRGAAGVGKTTLVRAVVEANATRFSEIEWVRATEGLANLEPLSRLPGSKRHIKQRLGYGPLLVIDDAEGLTHADEFASKLFQDTKYLGVILITRDTIDLRNVNFTLDLGPIPMAAWMKVAEDTLGSRDPAPRPSMDRLDPPNLRKMRHPSNGSSFAFQCA